MIDIAVLRAMAANGATVDMILAVVEAAQEVEQRELAGKREAARNRKRLSRASHASSRDVTNVTVTDVTENVHIDTYLLPSLSSKQKVKKERKVSISMPADWEPNAKNIEHATSRGWSVEYAHSEAARFRDHGLSTGKKYRDIDAAWRNWVTSPYQNAKPLARASPGSPPRPGSREDRAERTHNALNKLRNFANGRHADDAGTGGDSRVPDVGLLPFDKPP